MRTGPSPGGSADRLGRLGRLTELDAMRGIAAFSVVLSHACDNLAMRELAIFQYAGATPLRAMISGRHGVIFFFVLSGVVLTRALLAGSSPGFCTFALRRAIRLCLPAAAALLLSALLYAICFAPGPWLSPVSWMAHTTWTRLPSLGDIVRQTLLIGADGDFYLDPPLWTLVHELRLSLLLPLVAVLASRWDCRGRMLLLASCGVLFGSEIGAHLISRDGGGGLPLMLAYLALPLAIVALLAARLALLRKLFSTSCGPTIMQWAVVCGCVLAGAGVGTLVGNGGRITLGDSVPETFLATLYFAPCFLIGAALSLGVPEQIVIPPEQRIPCVCGALLLLCSDNLFAIAAASILLIRLALLPGRVRNLLQLAPLVFLGRISFSLYLVHVPLLAGLSHLLHAVLAPAAITGLAIVLSLPAAWGMYLAVERPAQRLARRAGLARGLVPA